MKKLVICVVAAIVACVMGAGSVVAQPQNSEPEVMSPSDSVSMLLGTAMANVVPIDAKNFDYEMFAKGFETSVMTLKMMEDSNFMAGAIVAVKLMQYFAEEVNMNEEVFLKAFKKGLEAERLSPEESMKQSDLLGNQAMEIVERMKVQAVLDRASTPEALAAKQNGEAYIAKMKRNKKYKTTSSGLMYRVITPGKGQCFGAEDWIKLKYVGKLVDGTVVENSNGETHKRILQVTPGCGEMLSLMKPGMKVEAIIPAALAYDIYGNPDRGIGPNETLVFEIETIDVDPSYEEEIEDVVIVEDKDIISRE